MGSELHLRQLLKSKTKNSVNSHRSQAPNSLHVFVMLNQEKTVKKGTYVHRLTNICSLPQGTYVECPMNIGSWKHHSSMFHLRVIYELHSEPSMNNLTLQKEHQRNTKGGPKEHQRRTCELVKWKATALYSQNNWRKYQKGWVFGL